MEKPSRIFYSAFIADQIGLAAKLSAFICCLFFVFSERGIAQSNQPSSLTNTISSLSFLEAKAQAEKGDARAQNAMGVMYTTGNGVSQDCFQASRWFRKAADQGDVNAQYHLALYFYDGERIDYKEAVVWYRKAADQKHAGAQNRLGLMFARGKGVSQDLDEAIKWFRAAADQGDADAKMNLDKTIQAGDFAKIVPPKPTRRLPTVESTNEITTTDGVTYKSVVISKIQPNGLVVEFSQQGGGIGMATLKFEILSPDLQQKYGYDPQRAVVYQTQQAVAQGQLRREMLAQYKQELVTARAIEVDNFKGRLEIERIEIKRKQAEDARVRAEAARERIAKAEKEQEAAQLQTEIRQNQLTREFIEQGYQIRDLWLNQNRRIY